MCVTFIKFLLTNLSSTKFLGEKFSIVDNETFLIKVNKAENLLGSRTVSNLSAENIKTKESEAEPVYFNQSHSTSLSFLEKGLRRSRSSGGFCKIYSLDKLLHC